MQSFYQIYNYINGSFAEPVGKSYLPDENPATATVCAQLPDSDERDVALAVQAAQQAFPAWSKCGAATRYRILNTIADLIERETDKLAHAETIDTGKPLWLSKQLDIPRARDNFRFFATAALHFASESHLTEGQAINYTLRQPLGVVGCISPWNLPLYLFSWKIAPALAAGNCVIAKPSELSPITAYLLCELCNEAALPPGVLNVIHGTGNRAGQAIVIHPDIKAISFTGGTQTGRFIASVAAPLFKKLSLELGGKNPTLIFADADFEKALDGALRAAFLNQGEICLCGSRILIEKSLYNAFKAAFVEKVSALKTGDPFETDTFIGAVISQQHLQKISHYIQTALQEGGRLLCGGHPIHPPQLNGYFIAPTVIEGLDANCRTNQDEIFGPVVTLQSFETEEEAIYLANSSSYGLAASVWTSHLNRAHRVAEKLHTGIVWINSWLLRDLRTPFGGMKNSGIGREGGWEVFRFFTEAKNVCIRMEY